MTEIKTSIGPDEVYWDMHWGEQFQKPPHNMPPVERKFDEEKALAVLLMNEVVFLNSFWWMYHGIGTPDTPIPDARWTKEESQYVSVNVNCNDVFAWGCADAEELPYGEIQPLYDAYIKDPDWGSAIWCIRRRKQMPQGPLEKIIREAGIWDMDEIAKEIAGA